MVIRDKKQSRAFSHKKPGASAGPPVILIYLRAGSDKSQGEP
jgi:hypothetical protein